MDDHAVLGTTASTSTEGNHASAPSNIAFTGRTVSSEMGTVRLGGSGRPVAIAAIHETSDALPRMQVAVERRQPRVVFQPQSRSPFSRKREPAPSQASELSGPPSLATKPSHFHIHETIQSPPKTVHATHYPTHRTPLAMAKRIAETQAIAEGTRPSKRVPSPSTSAPSSARRHKTDVVQAPSITQTKQHCPAGSSEKTGMATQSLKQDSLSPNIIQSLTTRPVEPVRQQHVLGFHEHVRFASVSNQDIAMDGMDTEVEPMRSGWRDVNDSIDHIFEDPSIDAVRLQLLLHGKPPGGAKRKAIEKERLQVAAAAVLKQRHGNVERMHELQRRKEQIAKLSEEIRSRNKPAKKPTPVTQREDNQAAHDKRKQDDGAATMTRKPPVPQLSQLSVKRKPSTKKLKTKKQAEDDTGTQVATRAETAPVASKTKGEETDYSDDEPSSNQDVRASDSILLPSTTSSEGHAREAPKVTTRVVKKRKRVKPASTPGSVVKEPSEPSEEKQQRRALAREYMLLQKQTRILMRAKAEEEKYLEEEKRKFELQRLERVRLVELEEARKRRIKLKQRRREAQEQKKAKQALLQAAVADTESNQLEELRAVGFERSHGNNLDSRAAPLTAPSSELQSSNEEPAVTDARLQKLLELGERTKQLTARLEALTAKKKLSEAKEKPMSATEFARLLHGSARSNQSDADDSEDEEDAAERERGSSRADNDEDGDDDDEYGDGHSQTYYEVRDDELSAEEDGNQTEEEEEGQARFHSRSPPRSPMRSTRVERERFVDLETAYLRRFAVQDDPEFDLGSIGVQRIHGLWPRDDGQHDDEDDNDEQRPRFEELPSSSSSSSDSAMPSNERRSREPSGFTPTLLEESVDTYAQRLLKQSERMAHGSASMDSSLVLEPSEQPSPLALKSASWLRDEEVKTTRDTPRVVPPTRQRNEPRSGGDSELLRLIRATDDNLSVIDREAKRLFHEQQKRLQGKREQQERMEQEQLKERLRASAARSIAEDTEAHDADGHERLCAEDLTFENLENVVQAVQDQMEEDCSELSEDAVDEGEFEAEEDEEKDEHRPVRFWNQELNAAPSGASKGAALLHVEIDRTPLQQQHKRQLEEREAIDSDGEHEDRRRVLSPESLSKRLLAAVEYHDAVQQAHAHLAMMEHQQALEEAQKDAIALAQAFKEDMEDQAVKQQLAEEHAVLEAKFDRDLQTIAEQLESVHETERRECEGERQRLEDEAKAARRRESSVQTEEKQQVHAATSARLRVESAMVTEAEKQEFGVQYEASVSPRRQVEFVRSAHPIKADEFEKEEENEEAYGEETFEGGSSASPTRVKQARETIREKHSEDEIEEASVASEDEVSEMDEEEEVVSEVAEENYDIEEGKDAISSAYGSTSMREQYNSPPKGRLGAAARRDSASVNDYDDNEFENEEEASSPVKSASVPSENDISEDEHIASIESSVGDDTRMEQSMDKQDERKPQQSEDAFDNYESDEYEDSITSEPKPRAATTPVATSPPTASGAALPLSVQAAPDMKPHVVPQDVANSYIEQLENRRRSELALLDIRLLALERQRQHETQKITSNTLADHERRKKSVELAFLSEKMAIESQKSACEARYYQDLLALQSLGELPEPASMIASVNVPASGDGVSSTRSKPVDAGPVRLKEEYEEEYEDDVQDAYSEDGFASATRSVVSDAQQSVEGEREPKSGSVSEAEDPPSVVEEEDDDESSVTSKQASAIGSSVHEAVDDTDNVQTKKEELAADEEEVGEYEDEFASMSESTKDAVAAEVEDDSIASFAPEVADDGSSGDIDEDEVYEEDEFASVDDGSTAKNSQEQSISEGESSPSPSPPRPTTRVSVQVETAPHDESSVMAASTSEGESTTTKLLTTETAALQSQLKEQEQRLGSPPPSSKLEKKKLKAQALLDAKDKLIKQQVDAFRDDEERTQVDTIAQLALQVDVEAEVLKGRDAVKVQLQSDLEALQRAYPQLVPSTLKPAVKTAPPTPSAAPTMQSTKVDVEKQKAAMKKEDDDDDVEYEYAEDDYDEYEVESFEKEGSGASSELIVEDKASHEASVDDDVADEIPESDTSADDVDDDVAPEVEGQEEDASVKDQVRMDDGDGSVEDYEDDYADEAFDDDQAAAPPSEADSINDALEENESAPRPVKVSMAKPSEEEEDDEGYSDGDFETSNSRRSSATSIATTPAVSVPEMVSATTPQLKNEADSCQDDQLLDDAIEKITIKLATTSSPTSTASKPQINQSVLGESVASSRHSEEEDLTTASMEEQTKRIEDLKQQIERRKAEYVQMQRQIKIEKRKERLREAETKLWAEMEQLENQLIADERILALTKQRGQLEALELETKHSDFRWKTSIQGGDDDLLGDCDYVEAVEPLKLPVVMQDNQVQVRFMEREVVKRAGSDMAHTAIQDEDDVDFLLACDHVEVAERPTASASTVTENEKVDKETLTSGAMHTMDSGKQGELGSESIDLLGSYDFVESVEAVESGSLDLMLGYDHVEDAEVAVYDDAKPEVGITRDNDAQAMGSAMNNETLLANSDVDQSTVDQAPASAAVEIGEVQVLTLEKDEETKTPDALKATDLEEEVVEEEYEESVASSSTSGSEVAAEAQPDPLVLEEEQDIQSEARAVEVEDSESDTDSHVPETDAFTIDSDREGEDTTSRITDRMLASLMQEAIADMTRVPRVTQRYAPRHDDTLSEVNKSSLGLRVAMLVEHKTHPVDAPTPRHDPDAMAEALTDRVFDEWKTAAIHDAVRIHVKRQGPAPVLPKASTTVSSSHTESTAAIRIPPPQSTDRMTAHSIAAKLELTADGAHLPRLQDCVGLVDRNSSNTRAIYDAVLEVTTTEFQQLVQDPTFRESLHAPSSTATLVHRVQQAMTESVWAVRDGAERELDRFTRRLLDDEQGDVDDADLRVLVAQRVTPVEPLLNQSQRSLMERRDGATMVFTPRQRRRSAAGSHPSLAAWLLHQEEALLADRITLRLMDELVQHY